MSLEQLSSTGRSCQMLLGVRAEIEEAKAIEREDVQAIVEPAERWVWLRRGQRRQRTEKMRAYCQWFGTHSRRLTELREAEAKLLQQIRHEVHQHLLATKDDYRAHQNKLDASKEVLWRIDHATKLARRATELAYRAEGLFNHAVAQGESRQQAAIAPYVHFANAAIDRLVTELYCAVMPLLRAHGEEPEAWELLPNWDARNNRVGHPKFYHLVGWCLEHNVSFTDPNKGLVAGANLAKQRLAEYRRRYKKQETAQSTAIDTAQEKIIRVLLDATAASNSPT